jgi:REP element-mobilizing transposase RayT
LRTAQKGRKLNTLSNNIKCGNSLIDDPEVAGEKAFNWQREFPTIFRQKEKKAWHVTWVTHDTRTSERMVKYKVRERKANGEMYVDRSVYLDEKDALKVTEIISEIIVEEKYNCLNYNIGEDHVHILLVCEEEELTNIVRKLKGKSAQKFKEHLGLAKDETFNLWAQKFNRKPVESEEQLANTIEYILNNREKHFRADIQQGVATPCLEAEQEFQRLLQPFVQKMTCSRQHAFRTEYKGGFDVVIGNPPYVHLEKIKETSVALKNANYETYNSQGDIYCVFVEKGVDVLKPNGLISYIMPNKWLQAGYGKPLRLYFLKYRMLELIDFGDIQIFDGATTYPCIFSLQKAKPQKQISISVLKESDFI